jgi:hypothetical protein
MLRRFAKMMKWPNLAETTRNLKKEDADYNLEYVSSHAMAFFTGLVLPGSTFPFLMMNSLIDVDPDPATDDLALLTHLHPFCGFQYRNSYTYWTSASIVGKVLAPTCREMAGWVGPARPTVDLGRSQIARIRSRPPRQALTAEDVRSMVSRAQDPPPVPLAGHLEGRNPHRFLLTPALAQSERSDPLGPPAEVYPVKEYALVAPDTDDYIDTVRIELLGLRPAADRAGEPGPRWFDASIQFAIDGVSWPLRLMFDVSFICAWPCSDGPHPLFFDYTYAVVKADEVVDVRDWARPAASVSPEGSAAGGSKEKKIKAPAAKDGDEERVLVVEAFGVPDNEVLARAWCAHWGLSAVVADIGRTW